MDNIPSITMDMNVMEEEGNVGGLNSAEKSSMDDRDAGECSSTLLETPQKGLGSLYSLKDESSSSSSLVTTKGFTFGANSVTSSSNGTIENGNKRNSLKYIPGPTLPPVTRIRSPVRNNRSPSPDRTNRRNSVLSDVPFKFASSSLHQPTLPGTGGSFSGAPSSNGSGSARSAVFRKGHRYKHSSVSMNFFQEPEVKVPLNIIKSLPVPEFKDLKSNLHWPKSHIQLFVIALEIMVAVYVFHVGRNKEWSSMSTLTHFLSYDIIGCIFSVLADLLSQFEVWKTGTITLPFGLNRIDVLLSFAFSVSICFVGLDLLFHVLEEIVVIFVESSSTEFHDEINQTIPHSHHTHIHNSELNLWYTLLLLAAFSSSMSFLFIFKQTHYKIKQSLITLSYLLYLAFYPIISYFHHGWDMVATVSISTFIISYGVKVANWTFTILILGFSTTSLNDALILDNDEEEPSLSSVDKNQLINQPLNSDLPQAVSSKKNKILNVKSNLDPVYVKSKIYDTILSIPNFQKLCYLKSSDLIISKVTFQLFIVLMKIQMKNGSNEQELDIRLSVTNLIKGYLPESEVTIEIERI